MIPDQYMLLQILLQLVLLFLVIFNPLGSLAVFISGTHSLQNEQRKRVATYALMVAVSLSLAVLFLGNLLLTAFNTTIHEFRVAGGIILLILGIKMTLGMPLHQMNELKDNKGMAIAAIIGTPLLTGPAAITAILVSTNDNGVLLTGIALAIVLFATAVMFYRAEFLFKKLGHTSINVMTTIMGLITVAWGVRFITLGIKALF
jgi:multiple antibiotic resistance protein